jgi:hypothetical protein
MAMSAGSTASAAGGWTTVASVALVQQHAPQRTRIAVVPLRQPLQKGHGPGVVRL